MIQKLTKSEIEDCINDIKRLGIQGLKGVEIKQCVQLLDEVRIKKNQSIQFASDLLISAIEYQYPDEYRNGREIEYWLKKEGKFYQLETIENILIKHLTPEPDIREQMEPTQITKPLKGKPTLSREQTALLFFYLREKRIIAQPENQNLATAIELMTGYSAKQLKDVLKKPGKPSISLGKDNRTLTLEDFETLISELEKLITLIKKDKINNSEKGEF